MVLSLQMRTQMTLSPGATPQRLAGAQAGRQIGVARFRPARTASTTARNLRSLLATA